MSISVAEALRPFKLPAAMLLVGLVGFFVGDWVYSQNLSDARQPAQPIAFSHQVHATDNSIPCMHCHVQAGSTPVAGIPPVSKCMGCHQVIATDSPEIRKLHDYWEAREPIPWVKVHDVPDFVHFTHKRHIKAGLECQQCHGPVQNMTTARREATLLMPWCTDCHTEKHVENGRDCVTCHK